MSKIIYNKKKTVILNRKNKRGNDDLESLDCVFFKVKAISDTYGTFVWLTHKTV